MILFSFHILRDKRDYTNVESGHMVSRKIVSIFCCEQNNLSPLGVIVDGYLRYMNNVSSIVDVKHESHIIEANHF